MTDFVDNIDTYEAEILPLLEEASAIAAKNAMAQVTITCTSESEDHEGYSAVYWATAPDSNEEAVRFMPVRLANALARRPEDLQVRINILQMTAAYLGLWSRVHIDDSHVN
jgi:hypothetical protein